jgi:hypothetical protein
MKTKSTRLNERIKKFFLRVLICLFSLAIGFHLLTPTASMQDDFDIAPPPLPVLPNANVSPNNLPKPKDSTNNSSEPTATVRGRVVYSDTGNPVRRTHLILSGSKETAGQEFSVLTDGRGEFEIKNIREGKYFAWVNTPGVISPFNAISSLDKLFENPDENAYAAFMRDFQEIYVPPAGGEIYVTITVKRGAAISGRIMYTDGEPAAGARVEILRRVNNKFSVVTPSLSDLVGAAFKGGGTRADDRGAFRFAGLPSGEYIVRVVENAEHGSENNENRDTLLALMGMGANSMLVTYFPNASKIEEAEIIRLEEGQESSEINFTIPDRNLRKVGIIVLNKTTRQPLKGVQVSIKGEENLRTFFGEMNPGNQTDEQGRLNFKEIPSGKYTLSLQPSGSDDLSEEQKPNAPKPPKTARTEKEIVVENEDIENLVIEVGYGAIISGTISFENNEELPSSLNVEAIEEDKHFAETSHVISMSYNNGKNVPKRNAEFKFEGLPKGKYFLDIANSYLSEKNLEDAFYVKSVLYKGKDIRFRPLELDEGESITGVQIILSKESGKLKGKVTRADQSAAVGAKILFVPAEKEKWANFRAHLFTVTDAEGEYEVTGAPGEYYVIFMTPEDETETEEEKAKPGSQLRQERLESKTSGAERVTIKARQTETANFKLP